MKKLMTACAACVLAGMVSAQVESVNIVGYNTITLQSQYTLIALNFDKVGDGSMTINEAFPYQDGMVSGTATTSDQILIRTEVGGYTTYRLRSTSTPANSWCLTATTPSTDTLPAGTAAWYFSRANPTVEAPISLTVAGQVANDATRSLTIAPGYNLFANPYPVDVGLNEGIGYQVGMTSGTATTADQILIRTAAGGYTTYRLRATSTPANSWCLTATTPTTDVLPAGVSAWYFSRGTAGFQMSFATPVP